MKKKYVSATVDAVESLYLKKDWQNIIKSRKGVRIPSPNPLNLDSYVHDQPDSIWEILDRDQVQVFENDPFLTAIRDNPTSALKLPNEIFLVDRTTKARFNKVNTGTLAFSQKSASAIPLKRNWKRILKKGDPFSWDGFFRDDVINSVIPSNALILVDRYLFSPFDDGLQNLMDILDALLPKSFCGCYQILLITDDMQIMGAENCQFKTIDEAVLDIQSVVPSLERPYEILLEVLLVHRAEKLAPGQRRTSEENALIRYYQETHDRHIFSNYFSVTAEHALSAVKQTKKGNLVASFKQTISFDAAYAGIDNKYQSKRDLPIKGCEDFVRETEAFVDSPNPICLFYSNAKRTDVKDLRNRLIK